MASHGSHTVGHIVPTRLLLTVGFALLLLTIFTVWTAKYVDLGEANIWLALAIALTKASLVVLYFMHLRWDSPFNAIVFICSVGFVLLFIGLAMADSVAYHDEMVPYEQRDQ